MSNKEENLEELKGNLYIILVHKLSYNEEAHELHYNNINNAKIAQDTLTSVYRGKGIVSLSVGNSHCNFNLADYCSVCSRII